MGLSTSLDASVVLPEAGGGLTEAFDLGHASTGRAADTRGVEPHAVGVSVTVTLDEVLGAASGEAGGGGGVVHTGVGAGASSRVDDLVASLTALALSGGPTAIGRAVAAGLGVVALLTGELTAGGREEAPGNGTVSLVVTSGVVEAASLEA